MTEKVLRGWPSLSPQKDKLYTDTAMGSSGPSPCSLPNMSRWAGALHWVNTAMARPLSTAAIWPARLELLYTALAGGVMDVLWMESNHEH